MIHMIQVLFGQTLRKNTPYLFRTIAIPRTIFDQLQQRAKAMGLSAGELIADLLKEIVHDGLYDAVLDSNNDFPNTFAPTH